MAPTITSPVSAVYGANAAPLATTSASLGVTNQPATTGGNAAVATGFDRTPATTSTPANQPTTLGQYAQNAAAANNTTVANVNAATNLVANQFGTQMANDLTTASGGGVISSALKSGVSSIVAFAQSGMQKIQQAIQGEMAANGGEVDPAKMQLYTMQMSTYELLNQMAAKIQEKQERSIQIWLQN